MVQVRRGSCDLAASSDAVLYVGKHLISHHGTRNDGLSTYKQE